MFGKQCRFRSLGFLGRGVGLAPSAPVWATAFGHSPSSVTIPLLYHRLACPPPPTRLYCPSAPSPGSHLPLRTPRGAGCLVRNHIIPEHSFAPSGSPRLLSLNFTVSSRSPSPHKLSFSAILSLPYNTSQTATAVPSIPRGQRSPFPDASRGFDPRVRPAARRLASRPCARAPRPQARRACALGAAPPPGRESPDLPEAPGEPPGAAAARGWAVGRAAGLGRASGR